MTVQLSKKLALKASLRLLYRNLPPLELIDLFDSGGTMIGQVLVEKDDLDSIFATSLVVNF